jgi:hypothetical protein
MFNLIFGMAVTAGVLAGDQAQTPVFRADIYVVPVEFSVGRRLFGFVRMPYNDLRLEDVTVVLDKNAYLPVTLTQVPEKPGHYVLTFIPPDEYRDGERHLVEVRLRIGRGSGTMPMTLLFPKPSAGADTATPNLFLITPGSWIGRLSN